MFRALSVAAIATILLVFATFQAVAEKRVALVIGNSDYSNVPALENPANDSADFASALERLGFEVETVSDQSYSDMRKGLRNFRSRVAGADIAVVYYAGHGIEVDKQNYLIPTDAALASDGDVDY